MAQIVNIIGGGLAGSEAAWQLAERGFKVNLYEMRPVKTTGAHVSNRLAELVCSNSLGSKLPDRASGLLQAELKMLGSLLLMCAEKSAVPAGTALAVDREIFAQSVTEMVEGHTNITIIRQEVTVVPDEPTIIATGPLTSEALAQDIAQLTGTQYLYFYDAIAPIVVADTIDMTIAFRASRFRREETGDGDYINCPMDEAEYNRFVSALRMAPTAELRAFEIEDPRFFEGCLPIEQLAARGDHTLAYGPMRPVGLRDPRTNKRPYAVAQLRRDNQAGSLYNIVGFQTNIRWGEQEKVLRLIPGLEKAEFVRMGQMHRNTFINAPALLHPTLQLRTRSNVYFAGQLIGAEGYVGNVATGLVAALNMIRSLRGQPGWILPQTTMLGALCHYITEADSEYFQPMKANFGLLPELSDPVKEKRLRYQSYSERALDDMRTFLEEIDDLLISAPSFT
jgi:methylenetetrahydrofolate--tRNA-(uracil-5-)-methyltransferase